MRRAVGAPSASRHVEAWASAAERRSLDVPPAMLKEGRANWRAVKVDPAFQARLAQELCDTRSAELTTAFKNLVWMVPGFRQFTRQGRHVLTNRVGVVFVVRSKGSVAPGHPQMLPASLLVYADHGGARKIFAVPTDVQDASLFASATAQTNSGIWVRRPPWPDSPGSVTCLVQLTSDADPPLTCVLSALHVMTPFADADSMQTDSQRLMLPRASNGDTVGQPALATTLPYGGVLRGDELKDRPSFDVQLAQADAQLFERVALRRFNPARPWVRNMAELLALDAATANAFELLTPDNHPRPRGPIPLSLSVMPAASTIVSIKYTLSRNGRAVTCAVLHDGLIVLKAGGTRFPAGGDSGSPIVVRHVDGTMTLVGMHIAGNDLGASWAIPAWQIFNLDFWRRYPAGAAVAPLDVP
ncbi:hypothetical protein [Ideonella sp.]|uniref:hypothetical protein n=1 Tax=Ideonella sp. TaxID=1929293 RepID=UPI0035AE6CD6